MLVLTGQAAIVTGASSGIGRAIAVALAAQGVQVGLVGRNPERLAHAASELPKTEAPARTYQADLTVDRDVERVASEAQRDLGAIDILVHSAGLFLLGEAEEASPEDLDRQYAVNVRAPYLLTRCLLPSLRARHGQIVFVNSTAALDARAKVGPYAATKHALRALADSLREEVNPLGIRVLSVFLGRTATPMQEAVHGMEGRPYHPELLLQPEDVAAVVLTCLQLPRNAEVTDVRMRPLVKSY